MMKSCRITTIIPTFNGASLLDKAIGSALRQTCGKHEIIVVDDGSTDNTREVVEKFGDRVRYIYQENAGPSNARNTGILSARGEYIAFLDSDDAWLPEKLEKQARLLDTHPEVDVVFTDTFTTRGGVPGGKTWVEAMASRDALLAAGGYLPRPWRLILEENFIPTCMVMARRSCFEKYGMFDEALRIGEDWDLWLRFSLHRDFYFIPEPLGRVTRDKDMALYDWVTYHSSFIELLRKFERENGPLLTENGITLDGQIAEIYFLLGYHYYGRGKYREARKAFMGGMRSRFTPKSLCYYMASIIDSNGVITLKKIKRRFFNVARTG